MKISHLRLSFFIFLLLFLYAEGQGQIQDMPLDSFGAMPWEKRDSLRSAAQTGGWISTQPEQLAPAQQNSGSTLQVPSLSNRQEETKQVREETEQGVLYETGMATYYSSKAHGRLMANGTRYDKNDYFCAHKKLPFGTRIRVVNKKNGKEVIVDVRDRGPFAKGRVIDLSNKAAEAIGMLQAGVVPVELWVIGK